jgi:hypothetical protein
VEIEKGGIAAYTIRQNHQIKRILGWFGCNCQILKDIHFLFRIHFSLTGDHSQNTLEAGLCRAG